MGRPSSSLLGSFSTIIVIKLLEWRRLHPGWGPKTLYTELQLNDSTKNFKHPKPSTIALLLKKSDLVKQYDRHIPLPNSTLQGANYPHHIWQIDGQGAFEVKDLGRINFINIKDIYSRLYIGSYPLFARGRCGSPNREDYMHCLRLAFSEFGLPAKIQVDHASAFYESKGKSPFPTNFHLWLASMGVELIFSRKYRPTDQAIVERSHQTIVNQVIGQKAYQSIEQLSQYTNQRRQVLNEHLPCRSCENQAPLIAYPKARHSNKYYSPQIEHQLINLEKVFQYLEKGQWIRRGAGRAGKTISLGALKYYVKELTPRAKVQISFDAHSTNLSFTDQISGENLTPQKIKGINIKALQGASFYDLVGNGFQLKIPL